MNEYCLTFARVDDRSVENEIFWAANDVAAEEHAVERCRAMLAWRVTDKAGAPAANVGRVPSGERLIAWTLNNQITAY